MNKNEVINWLKSGDVVISKLVNKYLFEVNTSQSNEGYIQKYLDLFDNETMEWGGGVYTPLWTSSHYTLLELKYMEISYDNPIYKMGTLKLLEGLWYNQGKVSKRRYQDMCMSAMLLSIVCYGRIQSEKVNEIVDYILDHSLSDGGWNCAWDSLSNKSSNSSFHTTLSVLEALNDYKKNGYTYRQANVTKKIHEGQEYLLQRHLMNSLSKNNVADPIFLDCHYPMRYRYDIYRALEYFVDTNYEYDSRMDDALSVLKQQLNKGPIPVGKQYSGKRHFRLETTKHGCFNTFRALKILKKYAPIEFNEYTIN